MAYQAEELTAAERLELAAHLARCANCAATAGVLEQLDIRLGQMFSSKRLGPDFSDQLQQRIAREGVVRSQIGRAEREAKLREHFEGCWQQWRHPVRPSVLIDTLSVGTGAAFAVWLLTKVALAGAERLPVQGDLAGIVILSAIATGVFLLVGLSVAFERWSPEL
jgi:anti-sigma factor RsiW